MAPELRRWAITPQLAGLVDSRTWKRKVNSTDVTSVLFRGPSSKNVFLTMQEREDATRGDQTYIRFCKPSELGIVVGI